MTYNVHACRGLDGRRSPERIAAVIARYAPDVVALQELDVHRQRSKEVHQPRVIAELLGMELHFQAAMQEGQGHYGNAVLSRLPMRLVKAGPLPRWRRCEPRGGIWVEITHEGKSFQVVTTHLGLRPLEQADQMDSLLGREWIEHASFQGPGLVCGDFNFTPESPLYHMFIQRFEDVRHTAWNGRCRPTWLGLRRLDYIFVNDCIRVLDAFTPVTWNTRLASDHFPLVADLVVREQA